RGVGRASPPVSVKQTDYDILPQHLAAKKPFRRWQSERPVGIVVECDEQPPRWSLRWHSIPRRPLHTIHHPPPEKEKLSRPGIAAPCLLRGIRRAGAQLRARATPPASAVHKPGLACDRRPAPIDSVPRHRSLRRTQFEILLHASMRWPFDVHR